MYKLCLSVLSTSKTNLVVLAVFFFFIELTCPSGGCLFAAINFFNLMAHGNGVVTLSILGGRTTKTLGLGQQREAENWHTWQAAINDGDLGVLTGHVGTSRVQGTSPSMMEGRGEADPEEEAGGRWRHGDGWETSVETCLRTAAWEWILVAARNQTGNFFVSAILIVQSLVNLPSSLCLGESYWFSSPKSTFLSF